MKRGPSEPPAEKSLTLEEETIKAHEEAEAEVDAIVTMETTT